MNILPLVSAFILIFAIGSYTFVHTLIASMQEKNHFLGALQVSHTCGRKRQKKYWAAVPGTNPNKKPASDKTSEITKYASPRNKPPLYSVGKLNIRLLMGEGNKKVERIFLTLIQELYSSQDLGPFLLKLIQEEKELDTLHDLVGIAPEEKRELIYKLLKGALPCDIETGKGYPALGDYVHIGGKDEKAVHFPHASRPLLSALFGYQVTGTIICSEKEKWEPKHRHSPLTKAELEQILLHHNLNLASFSELIDFNRKKESKKETIIEAGGLHVRKKIN